MADIGLLDFTARDLSVSYRASVEPQTLDIRIETAGMPETGMCPLMMLCLVEAINRGAGGDRDFSPLACAARPLTGPFPRPGAEPLRASSYAFTLEVTALTPLFIRRLVERLRGAGAPHPVRTMSIVGSLPIDATQRSVTEHSLQQWLRDGNAYPGEWEPAFEIEDREVLNGASVRVRFQGGVDDAAHEAFAMQMTTWSFLLADYFDHSCARNGGITPMPTVKRGEGELSAKWDYFDVVRDPARRMMANLLTWFHGHVTPIDRAIIALS